MRLLELEPQFLKRTPDTTWSHVDSISDADGIIFLCPVCFTANKGNVGTHSVICWQPHVPQTVSRTPARWMFQGSNYDDLTLVAASSSILLQDAPCAAHFFIRNGNIEYWTTS